MLNLPETCAALADFFDAKIVSFVLLVGSGCVLWLASEKQYTEDGKEKWFHRAVAAVFFCIAFFCFAPDDVAKEFPGLFPNVGDKALIFFILLFLALWNHVKKRLFIVNILLLYFVFSVQIIREGIRDTFVDANFFLIVSQRADLLVVVFIVMNLSFFILYIYSLYLLINFKKTALKYSKIVLGIYPVFTSLIPFLCNIAVHAVPHGFATSDVAYYRVREFFPYVFLIWNIPWILFFTFSKKCHLWIGFEPEPPYKNDATPPVIS